MARGRDPLVDLQHVDLVPWQVLSGERLEHASGRGAAAGGEGEAAAFGDGAAGLGRDEAGRPAGGGFDIRENLDLQVD
jgi:hypothetical protein